MGKRSPLWGNFIFYGDHDLLSFGLLVAGGLIMPAMYHGVQVMEKYFKALSLSIIDLAGVKETLASNPWLKTHDLVVLAKRCGKNYPYYLQPNILNHLIRFNEFDQASRYPWVNRKYGNGFSGSDIAIFEDIILHLRTDLPIDTDDYPLGIALRGHHHKHPEIKVNTPLDNMLQAVKALRKIFKNADGLVRH